MKIEEMECKVSPRIVASTPKSIGYGESTPVSVAEQSNTARQQVLSYDLNALHIVSNPNREFRLP